MPKPKLAIHGEHVADNITSRLYTVNKRLARLKAWQDEDLSEKDFAGDIYLKPWNMTVKLYRNSDYTNKKYDLDFAHIVSTKNAHYTNSQHISAIVCIYDYQQSIFLTEFICD